MKLAELLRPWCPDIHSDCDVSGLHNDSRQLKPGYLFIAYPGAAADGRLFIPQAVSSGAVAIIYDPEGLPENLLLDLRIPCIPISNPGQQLAAIASRFYGDPSSALNVIGVTGTNGKTTIAYLLAQAYELLGQKATYIGTLGQGAFQNLTPLANTTPDGLCLQQLFEQYRQTQVQTVCMEVSSHALSLGRVDHVHFDQAVFTNLSHEHLDFHHTMAAYAQAKAELFAKPELKTAVINYDDEYAAVMAASLTSSCQKLTYGLQHGCDVHAFDWQTGMTGSELQVATPWGKHEFAIKTLGIFNIYNNLAVFASLLAQGFSPTHVVSIMTQLNAAPGRMEVVAQSPCVIVDYAHTPDALKNVLQSLNKLKQGRIIAVFGCGGDRDKAKRPMMGKIASELADQVIITSDNPRMEDPDAIINEIAEGIEVKIPVSKFQQREEAIRHAIQSANPNDIILIAGKGHESYQQIGKERFVFSDQEIVKKWAK